MSLPWPVVESLCEKPWQFTGEAPFHCASQDQVEQPADSVMCALAKHVHQAQDMGMWNHSCTASVHLNNGWCDPPGSFPLQSEWIAWLPLGYRTKTREGMDQGRGAELGPVCNVPHLLCGIMEEMPMQAAVSGQGV